MKAIVVSSILVWGVAFCLLAIFGTSSSMSSDSTEILSLDEMQTIRGATYYKCISFPWGGGGCSTKDCWNQYPYSYKKYATSYVKCSDTTQHYACFHSTPSSPNQICAFGQKYLGPYCQSWFKLTDIEYWIKLECHQHTTS